MLTFYKMTNDEVRTAIQRIVHMCDNQIEVNHRAKEEFGYPYSISKPNGAGQRMSMFQATAFDGTTLS